MVIKNKKFEKKSTVIGKTMFYSTFCAERA
jgi:hypothetical protein